MRSDDAAEDPTEILSEGSSLPAHLDLAIDLSGQVFAHFAIEEEIGRGGQGVVYRAIDRRLGHEVALKVLSGTGPGPLGPRRRFDREAAVTSRLIHPAICEVLDAGVHSRVPYIAFRFVHGETLAAKIRRTRAGLPDGVSAPVWLDGLPVEGAPPLGGALARVAVEDAMLLVERVARALHVAHEAGVIHRDVKPGNIMVTVDGPPVVLDFGMARDSEGDQETLTGTGVLCGTPAYMSPEQLAGPMLKVDRRTDVYSLGVVLYECLTGRRPFRGSTREAIYHGILEVDPPDPRAACRAIPRDLSAVIRKALAKVRTQRYATARELADELARIRRGQRVAARERTRRFPGRRVVRSAAAAVVLAAILVTFVARSGDSPAVAVTEGAARPALEAGFLALREGRDAQAVMFFERWLVREPADVPGSAGLAIALLRTGRPKTALARLDGVRAAHPGAAALDSLRALVSGAVASSGRTGERQSDGPADAVGPDDAFVAALVALERDATGAGLRRARDRLELAVLAAPRACALYHQHLLWVARRLGDRALADRVRQGAAALGIAERIRAWDAPAGGERESGGTAVAAR